MRKPGRPNHRQEDKPFLVAMAENWRAGTKNLSTRQLSRIEVGLSTFKEIQTMSPRPTKEDATQLEKEHAIQLEKEKAAILKTKTISTAGKGKPESIAKRLERSFEKYKRKGFALPVSIYRIHNAERHSILGCQSGTTVGPFTVAQFEDPNFLKADETAASNIGTQCGMSVEEVKKYSSEGLEILRKCLPDEYSPKRI